MLADPKYQVKPTLGESRGHRSTRPLYKSKERKRWPWGSSGFRGSLPFLLCPSVSGWLALDCVTYLPGAQEHRHEVPEPCAQPNQQPQGPQEPRAAAERAQWGHLCRAHCQDDSRGEAWGWDLCAMGWEARFLQLCAGLGGGGFWLHEDEPGASYGQTSDSSCLQSF